jgi:hypothetical protein
MATPRVDDPQGYAQGPLEMFVPLHFWCCKDPRLAVASVSIPYGQRFIEMDLAPFTDMCDFVTRGTGTVAQVSLTTPTITTLELYINNIFTNPEVHDIYIKRIGFTLIRVHREQQQTLTDASNEILLNQMKWPIEALFVGIRPDENTATKVTLSAPSVPYTTGSAPFWANFLTRWHKYHKVDLQELRYSQVASITQSASWIPAAAPGGGIRGGPCRNWSAQVVCEKQVPSIDRLTISAHGIPIYNDFPYQMFNWYTPFQYGGYNINSPYDEGALMIPFNLYPGTYQPSGHINVSRAREFYLRYTSSVIGSSEASTLFNPTGAYPTLANEQARLNLANGVPYVAAFVDTNGDQINGPSEYPTTFTSTTGLTPSTTNRTGTLDVVASAINFLLLSDGSAVLRYST